jgi:hypothetical protein
LFSLAGWSVPGGIRTPNLLIRSQLLYPVELQTPFEFSLRHAQGLEPAEQAIFEFRWGEAIEKTALHKIIRVTVARSGVFAWPFRPN